MATLNYLDPKTGEYKKVAIGGGGGVSIPVSDTAPESGNFWLDTSEEGGKFYNAAEVNALLKKMKEEILGSIPETPVSSGVQMELLWENPSPTSNFNAQTLDIDCTGFDFLLVTVKVEKGTDDYVTNILPVYPNKGATLKHPDSNAWRDITFNDDGILVSNNENNTSINHYLIPVAIYGVKGVS